MLAHTRRRYAILAVYIDCGLKSCGSDIDRFRSPSLFAEIELFSRLHHSLCRCKDHIGRISCRLAEFWAAASPTLAAVSCLITCTMCVSMCVYCGWIGVYTDFTFDLCPLWGACMCVCERSVSCPCCAVEMMPWLSSARQPAACEVLARRPSSSPRRCQLPSLPLSARAQESQFHVRLTFKRAFHRSPTTARFARFRFRYGLFFFQPIWDWSVEADCNWFLARKTAQLIEMALLYRRRSYRMYGIFSSFRFMGQKKRGLTTLKWD